MLKKIFRFGNKPRIFIDISIKELNSFVSEHLIGDFDSICVAFADDIMQTELYFVMDGPKGMFLIVDESNNIPEMIFVEEPSPIDLNKLDLEYEVYLARFTQYVNTYRFREDADIYRKEVINYGR